MFSDDGVLSHKEFIVVMKNQLVRGLENVIMMIKIVHENNFKLEL